MEGKVWRDVGHWSRINQVQKKKKPEEKTKDSWNRGHLSDELQTLFSGNSKESMRVTLLYTCLFLVFVCSFSTSMPSHLTLILVLFLLNKIFFF